MTGTHLILILILTACYLSSVTSDMRLGSDGRYTRVTVRLSDDLPESQCANILSNLKVCKLYSSQLVYLVILDRYVKRKSLILINLSCLDFIN